MALKLLDVIGEVTACTRNGGMLTVCFNTRTVRIASREDTRWPTRSSRIRYDVRYSASSSSTCSRCLDSLASKGMAYEIELHWRCQVGRHGSQRPLELVADVGLLLLVGVVYLEWYWREERRIEMPGL